MTLLREVGKVLIVVVLIGAFAFWLYAMWLLVYESYKLRHNAERFSCLAQSIHDRDYTRDCGKEML